jgi:hypothetical protein
VKDAKTIVGAWKARFLLGLLALGAFIVPYVTGLIIEYARIRQWESMGFSPEQTHSWWRNGIWQQSEAIRWRVEGFDPDDAFSWKSMAFIAQDAKEWREAGFDVAGAVEWRRYAFEPSDAAGWRSAEFSIGDAVAWRKYGFGSLEARRWRDAGHSPLAAADKKRSRGSP